MIEVLTQVLAFDPPSGGEQPPRAEGIMQVIRWVIWGVSAVLFVLFIVGLAKAGAARSNGGQADASAPLWPLIAAIALGASATIWQALAV